MVEFEGQLLYKMKKMVREKENKRGKYQIPHNHTSNRKKKKKLKYS